MDRNYEFFQNSLILRRPRVAISAHIIKIVNMFIKEIFKDSKKVLKIGNYVSSAIYICISSYSKI